MTLLLGWGACYKMKWNQGIKQAVSEPSQLWFESEMQLRLNPLNQTDRHVLHAFNIFLLQNAKHDQEKKWHEKFWSNCSINSESTKKKKTLSLNSRCCVLDTPLLLNCIDETVSVVQNWYCHNSWLEKKEAYCFERILTWKRRSSFWVSTWKTKQK